LHEVADALLYQTAVGVVDRKVEPLQLPGELPAVLELGAERPRGVLHLIGVQDAVGGPIVGVHL